MLTSSREIHSIPNRRLRWRQDLEKLPVDLQWSTRASPNVNVDEAPGDRGPEPAVTRKCWYMTEALVNEHGRTMGCPRCSSGFGIHNVECRARIEGILLKKSRKKQHGVATQRRNQDQWSWRSRQDWCITEAAVGLEFSETMPPELGRREMLTRDRWKRLMSR